MIYAFVGPSGSGKTTLMREIHERKPRIKLIKSVTTRKPRTVRVDSIWSDDFDREVRREADDDLFYEFVDPSVFHYLNGTGRLAQSVEYAGNHYGTRFTELQGDGMYALTEDGVKQLRQLGYPVTVVRVVPSEYRVTDDVARRMADALRSQADLKADITIHNSHEPGGLEAAVAEFFELSTALSNTTEKFPVY